MKMKLPKNKWITLGVLGLVLVGGGYWAYKSFSTKPATVSTITGKVQRGDVRKVITATGTVSYPKLVSLTFPQSGKLTALNVAVGDTVKAGQVLAQIDPTNLQQALNQQNANLVSAQANLQLKQDNSLPNALSALAQAQQSVSTKQATLNQAKNNADPAYLANQVSIANQNVLQASNNLAQAMASGDSSKVQGAQSALTQAQQTLSSAQTSQNGGAAMALSAAQSDYEVAQQNLKLAQAQVDKLNQGTTPSDVLSAQAAVQQAEAQLQTAQTNLADASMTAPFDGIITAVAGQVGQNTDSKTAITLAANPDILQIDTSIDQADINTVKVGQKTDITLDTQPDKHISGAVSAIAVQGTSTQNVTTFSVTVTVDGGNTILKAGMNANVDIILDEAKNVLTVPSEAVKTRNGQSFVMVPNAPGETTTGTGSSASGSETKSRKNNQATGANNSNATGASAGGYGANGAGAPAINVHQVPVEIGLNDGSNVEIKSGLTEGQEIVVAIRAASTTTSGQRTGSPFGGGQGGAGASMGTLNRATSTGGRGR